MTQDYVIQNSFHVAPVVKDPLRVRVVPDVLFAGYEGGGNATITPSVAEAFAQQPIQNPDRPSIIALAFTSAAGVADPGVQLFKPENIPNPIDLTGEMPRYYGGRERSLPVSSSYIQQRIQNFLRTNGVVDPAHDILHFDHRDGPDATPAAWSGPWLSSWGQGAQLRSEGTASLAGMHYVNKGTSPLGTAYQGVARVRAGHAMYLEGARDYLRPPPAAP